MEISNEMCTLINLYHSTNSDISAKIRYEILFKGVKAEILFCINRKLIDRKWATMEY